jgi:hypothetical protein
MLVVSHDPHIRLLRTELGIAYRAHLPDFTRHAARQAVVAALRTESAPDEALDCFDWLLDDQLRFAASFVDSWGRIGGPFRAAAMPGRGS